MDKPAGEMTAAIIVSLSKRELSFDRQTRNCARYTSCLVAKYSATACLFISIFAD